MGSNFEGLTDEELEVFGRLTLNVDRGHPPEILSALLARGLVVHPQSEHGPFRVVRVDEHVIPLAVHERWCEWCDEHYGEDGRPKRPPKEKPAPSLDKNAAIGPLPGMEGGS